MRVWKRSEALRRLITALSFVDGKDPVLHLLRLPTPSCPCGGRAGEGAGNQGRAGSRRSRLVHRPGRRGGGGPEANPRLSQPGPDRRRRPQEITENPKRVSVFPETPSHLVAPNR